LRALLKTESMNPAYRPMLATLVDEPFDDKRWVFETKWDGFRLITEKRGHALRLWSRNGIDVTTRTLSAGNRHRRVEWGAAGMRDTAERESSDRSEHCG
jgi:bifunctional non-homologous end joining protein LigD